MKETWDLVNLAHFDYIKLMIPITMITNTIMALTIKTKTMITLSGANCITISIVLKIKTKLSEM
jgi:hypothetical protein